MDPLAGLSLWEGARSASLCSVVPDAEGAGEDDASAPYGELALAGGLHSDGDCVPKGRNAGCPLAIPIAFSRV